MTTQNHASQTLSAGHQPVRTEQIEFAESGNFYLTKYINNKDGVCLKIITIIELYRSME